MLPTVSAAHRRRRIIIATITSGLVFGMALITVFQPWTANHFGYALPGKGKLPYRVHTENRSYDNVWMCAGADWCVTHSGPGYCTTGDICQRPANLCTDQSTLQQRHELPLQRIGTIWTMFGPPHSMFAGNHDGSIFVEDTPGCYIPYSLNGGP